jgi:GTPase
MPFGEEVTIKAIEHNKNRVDVGYAGMLCEISIEPAKGLDPQFIKAGQVICDMKFPVH